MKVFKWPNQSILTLVEAGCKKTQVLRFHQATQTERRLLELQIQKMKNTINYEPEHQIHHLDEYSPYEGSTPLSQQTRKLIRIYGPGKNRYITLTSTIKD